MEDIEDQDCESILQTNKIDARKLHKALNVKSRFNDWIRYKIGQHNLEEDVDYTSTKLPKAFELSSSAAIEIIMNEKTDMAKKLREDFIQLARKQSTILTSLSEIEMDLGDNPVDLVGGVAYLSSLKIAEISGKRHDNIVRDIESEISNLKSASNKVLEDPLKSEDISSDKSLRALKAFTRTLEGIKQTTYLDPQGRTRKAYLLNEAAAYQVLLRYSSEFRSLFISYFLDIRDALLDRYRLITIDKTLPETSGKRQYVYIIRDNHKEHIKIGIATDPHKRLAQLQTGNSTPLELEYVSYVCSNASEIEASLHKHFKDKHVFGEWFDANSSEVIEFLSKSKYILMSNLDFSLESRLNEVIFALEHQT